MIASSSTTGPTTGTPLGLPEAARHFGVSVRMLRHAMRAGRLPSPVPLTAVTALPASWLAEADAAVEKTPGVFKRVPTSKVAEFARFKGTSAWQKHRSRARAYAQFRATP